MAERKILVKGSTADLNTQEKSSVNMRVGRLILSSLKKTGKKK